MKAGLFAVALVVSSAALNPGNAFAKVDIDGASIVGPGLGGGLQIEAPDSWRMWESGMDIAGGLDDARATSLEELGLDTSDLGPRYLVTYAFTESDIVRQAMYPYARGGPVTYTPPGQELAGLLSDGDTSTVTSGWYQTSAGFFWYLVEVGLPDRHQPACMATDAIHDPAGGLTIRAGLSISRFLLG